MWKKESAWIGQYIEYFRCVNCHAVGTIHFAKNEARCRDCDTIFPMKDGRPILLTSESITALENELSSDVGQAMVNEYAQFGSANKKTSWRDKLYHWLRPPEIMLHYNPDMTKSEESWQIFSHKGSNTRILNVGGGPSRYSDQEITLNIRPFFNVDCVGDGHNIPFGDETFDSIVCNAVLEHVHQPEIIVKEMLRVLKPGGQIYVEIPFIFFFHGYPNDFKRYTSEGIKYLFRDLDPVKVGMTHGPISAILQSINLLVDMLVPSKVRWLQKGINGAYRWLFFWLKYFDLLLKNNDKAKKIAGGFWLLGRKPKSSNKQAIQEAA